MAQAKKKNLKTEEDVLGPGRYKQVFDLSPEGIVIFDKKGKIIDANNRLYDWLKYRPGDIKGKSLLRLPFISKKGKLVVAKKFASRMLGKNIAPYEIEFVAKDGKILIGLIRAMPIRDNRGKIVGDMVMVTEVTKEIKEEKKNGK